MILKIYTDGASRGNPGEAAAAAVLYNENGDLLEEHSLYLGQTTNNIAEYRGMILGLERARELGATTVRLFADSQLLVRQMLGEYRVKNEGLRPLFLRAKKLAASFNEISFRHIPRRENKAADALANRALDEAAEGVAAEG